MDDSICDVGDIHKVLETLDNYKDRKCHMHNQFPVFAEYRGLRFCPVHHIF